MLTDKYPSALSLFTSALLTIFLISCGSGRHTVSRGVYHNDDIYYSDNKGKKEHNEKTKKKNYPVKNNADLSPVVAEAFSWIGTRYRYGGHSRSGTDCSGMVWEIYRNVMAIDLPRSSWEQQEFCHSINASSLTPGDLVFFTTQKNGKVSHVGIYVGSGEMIHASQSKGVIKSSLDEAYYKQHYHSSGRVFKTLDRTSPTEMPRQKIRTDISFENLDNAISEKTDSILSSYMD